MARGKKKKESVPAKILTPRQIVAELDKYIIGQSEAKRAVAIALRNRWRRQQLAPELQEEVTPKNIIMIGPTGVGKTEIARRLANLAQAPFLKIEATKFTEVGYVGRDVDSMARDLTELSVQQVKREAQERVEPQARVMADERLADILIKGDGAQDDEKKTPDKPAASPNADFFEAISKMAQSIMEKRGKDGLPPFMPQGAAPFDSYPAAGADLKKTEQEDKFEPEKTLAEMEERLKAEREERRKSLLEDIKAGKMDEEFIELDVPERGGPMLEIFSSSGIEEMGMQFKDVFGNMFGGKTKKRKLRIKDAREFLAAEESQKLIDMDEIVREALFRVEQSGIIFIDEIDKIAGSRGSISSGPDVSREGVQRDILPIVEGSTIMTKYGPVRTNHILFIASGAFHVSKPSDLIPELQGRFPIRVELKALSAEDFERILTEPENSLVKQYKEMIATESVELEFTPDSIKKIAQIAFSINERSENIGARRLYTVMERLLEEISFEAPDMGAGKIPVTASYVESRLKEALADEDLSKYIL